MAEEYYCGRRWGTYAATDAVKALTDAQFPKGFATKEVAAAAGGDVFVAFDEKYGVRLVRMGDTYDRWYVRYLPRFPSEDHARFEAERMAVLHKVSGTASPFPWVGKEPHVRPFE